MAKKKERPILTCRVPDRTAKELREIADKHDMRLGTLQCMALEMIVREKKEELDAYIEQNYYD